MNHHDENWISPEVRSLLNRVQADVRRVEALEALFLDRNAARLPYSDEDPE